jgi:hypothetical protein
MFAEPAIVVSGSKTTRNRTVTNFQAATFTHAGAVEPTSAFQATINWGDGTSSAGTITLSGTTYSVTGSHTYPNTQRHTITTTVTEIGQAVDKVGDEHPGQGNWREQDVVHLPWWWNLFHNHAARVLPNLPAPSPAPAFALGGFHDVGGDASVLLGTWSGSNVF